MTNPPNRYGIVPQFLHWVMVVLVIVAWTLGTFGDELPKGEGRAIGLIIHSSAGLLVVVTLIVRLAWRVAVPAPPPESNQFGRWLGRFAGPSTRLAHYTLYALLIAVLIAGIIEQFARGDALPLLGIGEITSPWIQDRAFAHSVKEIHEIAAHALVIVAIFHAATALIHHFVFRDNTLQRMLPHGNS